MANERPCPARSARRGRLDIADCDFKSAKRLSPSVRDTPQKAPALRRSLLEQDWPVRAPACRGNWIARGKPVECRAPVPHPTPFPQAAAADAAALRVHTPCPSGGKLLRTFPHAWIPQAGSSPGQALSSMSNYAKILHLKECLLWTPTKQAPTFLAFAQLTN